MSWPLTIYFHQAVFSSAPPARRNSPTISPQTQRSPERQGRRLRLYRQCSGGARAAAPGHSGQSGAVDTTGRYSRIVPCVRRVSTPTSSRPRGSGTRDLSLRTTRRKVGRRIAVWKLRFKGPAPNDRLGERGHGAERGIWPTSSRVPRICDRIAPESESVASGEPHSGQERTCHRGGPQLAFSLVNDIGLLSAGRGRMILIVELVAAPATACVSRGRLPPVESEAAHVW